MTSSQDDKPTLRGRAAMLELNELIAEVIDARSWARQGVQLMLTQEGLANAQEERTESARASAQRATEHWNAMTLIAIYGGLEDLVETMGSGLFPVVLDTNHAKRQQMFEQNRLRNRELREVGELSEGGAQVLTHLTNALAGELLKKPLKAPAKELPAADGWEDLLSRIHLQPIPGRPLPDDLRLTLNELGAIRNVTLHRMGRIDARALELVEEGPWTVVDQLVVIDDDLYKRYIAALISYQREINDRIRNLMGLTLLEDIAQWRSKVPAGG
jgi:hypothetical protein